MSSQGGGSEELLVQLMLLEQLSASSTPGAEGESRCPRGTNSCSDTRTSDPVWKRSARAKFWGMSRAKIKFLAPATPNLAEHCFDPRTFGV